MNLATNASTECLYRISPIQNQIVFFYWFVFFLAKVRGIVCLNQAREVSVISCEFVVSDS